MSAERALLRRLVEWDVRRFQAVVEGEKPREAIAKLAEDARALLAEPEPKAPTFTLKDGTQVQGCAPDSALGELERRMRELTQEAERVSARPTPRSRAEGSDLSVDQGREFRVVDGLGDSNRAGKVTIDPTLLSPPTPRSRAEAEAMVEAHCHAIREHGVHFTEETRVARDKARAALLAALTGEGK